ncbi:MAG: putative dehydrogenase [Myxococcota bacterium]
MRAPLRVALVGCGRMGTLHARTVANHPATQLTTAVDAVPARAAAIAATYGGRADDRVGEADLVIVATPTSTHRAVCAPLLAAGHWVLVEKPVGNLPEDAFVHPRALVGHCERFNPAVRAGDVTGLRLLDATRLSPPTGRSGDVDVITDLMVHDLDLLLSWVGEVRVGAVDVREVRGGRVEWVVAHFDFAGGSARLEASRVARAPERRLRLHDDQGSADLDLLAGDAVRGGRSLVRPPQDALTAQLDALVDTVRGAPYRGATSAAGRRVVELAEAVRRMAQA